MHPAFFMSAKSARNCRKAFRWAHIKKSWASGAPKTPTENPAQPPLLRGGCAGGALLFRCGFPVCPHVCRGRVEVNLQRITDRASVLFFGAGGGTLVHTHFSKTQNSNYCRLLPSHAPARAVSVPGASPFARRWCVCVLGAAAGLGCWVLGAGCWVLGAGCWCWWLVVSHTLCKGICRACGCAAYVTCAGSQTPRCRFM